MTVINSRKDYWLTTELWDSATKKGKKIVPSTLSIYHNFFYGLNQPLSKHKFVCKEFTKRKQMNK